MKQAERDGDTVEIAAETKVLLEAELGLKIPIAQVE